MKTFIIWQGAEAIIYTNLSSKNQITLPAEYRHRLGLKPKDRLEISEKDGQLILRKAPDFLALKGFFKGMKRIDERAAAMDAAFERSMGIRPDRLGKAARIRATLAGPEKSA